MPPRWRGGGEGLLPDPGLLFLLMMMPTALAAAACPADPSARHGGEHNFYLVISFRSKTIEHIDVHTFRKPVRYIQETGDLTFEGAAHACKEKGTRCVQRFFSKYAEKK